MTNQPSSQSHLPPSIRIGPEEIPYTQREQEAIAAMQQGETWLCHTCKHGGVVRTANVRGTRTYCDWWRMEMREVKECSRVEAKG